MIQTGESIVYHIAGPTPTGMDTVLESNHSLYFTKRHLKQTGSLSYYLKRV